MLLNKDQIRTTVRIFDLFQNTYKQLGKEALFDILNDQVPETNRLLTDTARMVINQAYCSKEESVDIPDVCVEDLRKLMEVHFGTIGAYLVATRPQHIEITKRVTSARPEDKQRIMEQELPFLAANVVTHLVALESDQVAIRQLMFDMSPKPASFDA